jgi:gamma-glutamyl hercynylcysteine S-oxide synthase
MAISPSGAVAHALDRDSLIAWFAKNRARSAQLFAMLDADTYYQRPISLRNPIVFYEGHLPAFNVIVLIKRGLGQPGVDEKLERLFARGIDPEDEQAAAANASSPWPSREAVQTYARAADDLMIEALRHATIDRPGHPVLDRAEGAYTALEHEAMHQETLLYMWHRLPHAVKQAPENNARGAVLTAADRTPPVPRIAHVPAGRTTLGASRHAGGLNVVPFGWDNEFDAHVHDVPAFDIDVYNVTNADFLRFMDAGGYDRREFWTEEGWNWREAQMVTHPIFWERRADQNGEQAWHWRGQFEYIPLPLAWPVYVSHAEACAYAEWAGGRLPTEAEYHRAAFGTPQSGDGRGPERQYPWGDAPPDATRANLDFERWDPVAVGSRPLGASAWGVEDLVGNGWEWTSTIFEPFPGFKPMAAYPEYSADFFDGQHYVMKGASPVTAKELVRPSFRNWFRHTYPYVYATFRCVRDPR